jgi:hypothetical protein
VGKADARTTTDRLSRYANGSGTESVKRAIDSYSASSYSSARVTNVQFGAWTLAATSYLAATFDVEVLAPGGN